MKTALFVPGYHPTRVWKDDKFDILRQETLAKNVRLVGASIPWSEHTTSSYTTALNEHMRINDDIRTIVGHSVGTIVALKLAGKRPVDRLLLCFPSALYADDIDQDNRKKLLEVFSPKQIEDFESMDTTTAVDLISNGETKTTVTYGELEREFNPSVYGKTHQLASIIPGATLVEIPGAGHSVRSSSYAEAVGRLLSYKETE